MARIKILSSKTLEDFIKNLNSMHFGIQELALKEWDEDTLIVQGKARENAPMTIGRLVRSIQNIKAKITKKGLESYIVAKVPYAKMLEIGERNGKRIRLKAPGELSYYLKGKKRFKKKKGQIGYISKAIDDTEDLFINGLKTIISKIWYKI